MYAKDAMRKKVITARPEMTVAELARLFVDNGITGAPVVDAGGNLLGVVSQTDLVRREREAPAAEVPAYHLSPEEPVASAGFHVESPDYTRVKDVMTPAVISFEEETPLREVAKAMLRRHVHRVVITRGGALSGIVTSMDVMRALVDGLPRHPPSRMKECF